MSNNNRPSLGTSRVKCWLAALGFAAAAILASAQEPRKYTVELKAAVSSNPAAVTLSWAPDAAAAHYTISRKSPEGREWQQVASLGGTDGSWTDGNVSQGNVYEYQVVKQTSSTYTGYGYICAAIDRPLVEDRGKVLLVIAENLAEPLQNDISRFTSDLAGDGWTVVQQVAKASYAPPVVKEMISTEWDSDPGRLKAVILIGHVAVPYSGDIAPDKHPDHQGAWPADAYYADLDGNWTDQSVNSTTAEREANRNTPGDGKFDQSIIPSGVELAVGRIDLSLLTCFANKAISRNEIDLTRQYFNKNHAFRHAQLPVLNKALIYNDVAVVPPEPAISYAYRTLIPLVGRENVEAIELYEFLPKTASNYYLWAAATSGGGWTYANGVAKADELAVYNVNAIFTFFCSSYFGDWNTESNFLRCVLGASGGPLTAAYGSRPTWLCHPMGVGDTIGRATMMTMDNHEGGAYPPHLLGSGMIHTALLGDPTLRMIPIAPPGAVQGAAQDGKLILSWGASPAPALAKYAIYKSSSVSGPFLKIGETSGGGQTSFEVQSFNSNDIFQVRAVAMTTGPSGSYWNSSQGVYFAPANGSSGSAPSAPKSAAVWPLTVNSIRVRWVATSSDQSGFIIQRKAPGESVFSEIGRVGYEKAEFVDNNLPVQGYYSYRVGAFNSAGTSAFSEAATCANKAGVSDFLAFDTVTSGDWIGKYGQSGYSITWLATNLPATISMTMSNIYTAAYGPDQSDTRLLESPSGEGGRLAAWWGAGMPFGVEIDCRDDETRRVAFYFVDWNHDHRTFKFEAIDVTSKNVLFEKTVESYDAVYLTATVKGRVFFKVTPAIAYQNELLLGVFLDPAPAAPAPSISPAGGTFAGKVQVSMSGMSGGAIRYTLDGSDPVESSQLYPGPFTLAATALVKARVYKPGLAPSPVATASFQNSLVTTFGGLGADDATQGGWRGVYGNEGFLLPTAGSVSPDYSEFNMPNTATWVWQDSTSDERGQIKPFSTDRMAACWYDPEALQFDLSVLDTATHSIALYFLDWDNQGRRQTVQVFDMSGNLLDTQEVSSFSGGLYLRYKVKGQVRFKITRLAGDNAVLNGIFFDEGPAEAPVNPPVQSFAIGAGATPVFTFAAPTGTTLCIDISDDLKTWQHTGNRIVSDGKIEIKESDFSGRAKRFFRSHVAE